MAMINTHKKIKTKQKAKNLKSTYSGIGGKLYSYSGIMYYFEINELKLHVTHRWISHWYNFEWKSLETALCDSMNTKLKNTIAADCCVGDQGNVYPSWGWKAEWCSRNIWGFFILASSRCGWCFTDI